MKLITKNEANQIAMTVNSKEHRTQETLEYIDLLIKKQSKNGEFEAMVLFNQLIGGNDILNDVVDLLKEAGYKVNVREWEEVAPDLLLLENIRKIKNGNPDFRAGEITISWE